MEALIIDENENEEPSLDSIRVFDPEELGFVSSEDLKIALKSMPGSAYMSDFELRDILQKADPDKDGKIDIQGNYLKGYSYLLNIFLVEKFSVGRGAKILQQNELLCLNNVFVILGDRLTRSLFSVGGGGRGRESREKFLRDPPKAL